VDRDPAFLHQHLRDIPDFPSPGVLFKDITPLLADGEAFRFAVDAMADPHTDDGVDQVIGVEARGFLFAAPIAYRLGAGCVPFRKPGKLPYETVEHTYELEYGTDTLAAHVDALERGPRVLLVDDVLATGGTARAACDLVRNLGGEVVACTFLLEITALGGRDRLAGERVERLLAVG
jgi:adenine phosphoribosyltransferase